VRIAEAVAARPTTDDARPTTEASRAPCPPVRFRRDREMLAG